MQAFKVITKTESVIDSVTCNGCGAICTDAHTKIKTSGGYNSPVLSDCTHYSFDLCENCLVKIMDGLKHPPSVADFDGVIDYTLERKRFIEQKEREETRQKIYAEVAAKGLCVSVLSVESGTQICGLPVIGKVNDEAVCAICIRDEYHVPGVITRDGISITFEERKNIAMKYLQEMKEKLSPNRSGPHTKDILINTAVASLLSNTKEAIQELIVLTGHTPIHQDEWINSRIPCSFKPYDEMALHVNDWLFWAKLAGYKNASASVCLGNSPEDFWTYYE